MERDYLDRLIDAGWGDVDGDQIPPEVRAAAERGDPIPPHGPVRKKAGPKTKEERARAVVPSRWFRDGEKPQWRRGKR